MASRQIRAHSTIIQHADGYYYIEERKMIGPFVTKQEAKDYRELARSRENPLHSDDWLRIGVGIALVAGLGFMFWQKSQENALSANTTAPTPVSPVSTSGFSFVSATATDINPGPVPPAPPPPPGGVPIPSPPTA